MSNIDDASVKLLYAADSGTQFTIDNLKLNDPFDVLMDVEIGANLNQIASAFDARVGVRNLTQSKNVAVAERIGVVLVPSGVVRQEQVKLSIPVGWETNAAVGDVLQVVGSYTVKAGLRRDVSVAESPTFVVIAKN
jgi:hypothetical protein